MNFFRRETKKNTTPTSARGRTLQDIFAPIPVAEVTESTWNEWEDSVAFQNSQGQTSEPASGESLDISLDIPAGTAVDPFASVTKKGS